MIVDLMSQGQVSMRKEGRCDWVWYCECVSVCVCCVVGPNGRNGSSSYVGPVRKFRSTDACATMSPGRAGALVFIIEAHSSLRQEGARSWAGFSLGARPLAGIRHKRFSN